MTVNAIEELEKWHSESKGRYVRDISIDDGFGATCWRVILGNTCCEPKEEWYLENPRKKWAEVFAAEVSFFEYDAEGIPPNVVYVGLDDDWPGLAATILAAIAKANELGL